jgi:hypothetical protein
VCLRGIVGEIGVLTGWVILVVRIASRIAQPCDVHRLGWGALDRCDPPRVCRTGRQKSVKSNIHYASVTLQKFCRMVPKRFLVHANGEQKASVGVLECCIRLRSVVVCGAHDLRFD